MATVPSALLIRTRHWPTCQAIQVELADVTSDGVNSTPDGKLDAILYCLNTRTLAVMAGNGAGGFGPPHVSPAPLNSSPINYDDFFAVGLFNPFSAAPLFVYRNSFGSAGAQQAFCSLESLQAQSGNCGDAPGDSGSPPSIDGPMVPVVFGTNGRAGAAHARLRKRRDQQRRDLVSGRHRAAAVVLGAAPVWADGRGGRATPLVTAADLNGDGHPDIITSSQTSSGGVLNTSLATDGSGEHYAAPDSFTSVAGISALITGDFDGDGHTDVLAAGGYGEAYVQAGNGAGGLGLPQSVPLIGAGDSSTGTVVEADEADIDGNGTPDAVILDETRGMFEVLRNLNAPPVIPPAPPPVPAPPLPLPPPPPPGPVGVRVTLPGPVVGGEVSAAVVTRSFTLTVGHAKNPPTSSVSLTVTIPRPSARARRSAHSRSSAHKVRRIRVAQGTVRIPAGKQRPLTLRLNHAGRRALLAHARVRARLTLVARGPTGLTRTHTRPLTIVRHPSKKRSGGKTVSG